MKTKLLILLFTAYLSSYAQYTNIPDPNFENALIAQGLDTGAADGKVLTASIKNQLGITLSNKSITNLTGIEGFTNLETLICRSNAITSLNLSQNQRLMTLDCTTNLLTNLELGSNPKLVNLDCGSNPFTTLDLSSNTLLEYLVCDSNKLTVLNLANLPKLFQVRVAFSSNLTSIVTTNDTALKYLFINSNKLTTLDLSTNAALDRLECYSNQLTDIDLSNNKNLTNINFFNNKLSSVNVKNGNNTKFTAISFTTNPSLKCILVDDADYSNTNWASDKDATATYTTNCATLGIEQADFDMITVYPNPTKGELNISNIALEKATVYNALGQVVKSFTLNKNDINNTIYLSGLPKGVYYVYLQNQEASSAKKIIIE